MKIKKNFDFIKKIGHGGILDNFATGILVIGINKHTKNLSSMINADKEYIAKIQFNTKTTTYDLHGEIVQKTQKKVELAPLQALIQKYNSCFCLQKPPLYSAIKVQGKRLYKYAREKKEVVIKPRRVEINFCQLLHFDYEKQIAEIKLSVGKGFYVRSFGNDLGLELGNFAHVIELRRTKVGPFKIQDCSTLKDLGINLKTDINNLKNLN